VILVAVAFTHGCVNLYSYKWLFTGVATLGVRGAAPLCDFGAHP